MGYERTPENQAKFMELIEDLKQQKRLIASKNIELRDCVGQGLLFLNVG